MPIKLSSAIALLGSVIVLAVATPAMAHDRGHPHHAGPVTTQPAGTHARHGVHRRHARMLPPEMAYRDPNLDLRPRGRPDFLIHAYLPRFSDVPMYNEPPARFPR